MKNCLFTGVCTALVTPFAGEHIDEAALYRLLDFQTANGINTFVLTGTTGEAPTLSDSEKEFLWKQVRTYLPKAVLLMGAGSNDTRHATELSKRAQNCGADGVLVVTPYYNKATPRGLLAHYEAVADAVSVPVVMYNVPSRTGVGLPVDICARLSRHENILGLKEASGNLRYAAEVLAACPKDFYLWSGNDDLTVPLMALGGKGVISVASHIVPKALCRMTAAAAAGDYPAAAEIQLHLLPLMDALFSEVNPIPVKEALSLIGLPCGVPRLPLTPMSPEKRMQLASVLLNL